MDSQLPLNCSKRHPLAPGFLDRLPSLPLKERQLARRGGFGLAGGGHAVSVVSLILLVSTLESNGSRTAIQRSAKPLVPEGGTGTGAERPWPLRRNTGLGATPEQRECALHAAPATGRPVLLILQPQIVLDRMVPHQEVSEVRWWQGRGRGVGSGRWAAGIEGVHGCIAGRFHRSEPRRRALDYLKGLISPLERKNGWQLAERAGRLHPRRGAAVAVHLPVGRRLGSGRPAKLRD